MCHIDAPAVRQKVDQQKRIGQAFLQRIREVIAT
jgi:hypothetical protein